MKKYVLILFVLLLTLIIGCAAADGVVLYPITVTDGIAEDFDTGDPVTRAAPGQKIMIGFESAACPDGKYISSFQCVPETLKISKSYTKPVLCRYYFVMPEADVTITAVYSSQTARIVDLRSGLFEMKSDGDKEVYGTFFVAAEEYDLPFFPVDDVLDLDNDGKNDIEIVPEKITVLNIPSKNPYILKVPKLARYSTLTLVFTNPKVSFSANGGSGTMAAAEVTASDFSYTLPECGFTAPSGKAFEKWDKGAPGTKITVTADTVIKAVWKDLPVEPVKPDSRKNQVTYKGGVYKLNHKKLTATFIRPASKNATKLTIQNAVSANKKKYKVTAISPKACMGMKNLTTLNIGKNVKKIGKQAFENCKKLKRITIKNAKMKKAGFGLRCFCKISPQAAIRVPKKALKKYTTWIRTRGKPPKTVKIFGK